MAQDRLNQEDLTMRLDHTICRWKGHPYFIMTGDVNCRYPQVALYKLNGSLRTPTSIIDHRDDNFDDSSPTLGYMNYGGRAFYLKRMPHRWQNQGLKQQGVEGLPNIPSHSSDWFIGPSMEACILGRFPTYDKALTVIQAIGSYSSQAIHRDIAIGWLDSRRLSLYYKTRVIATKQDDDWIYLDSPDKDLIKRIIEKTGVIK